MLPSVVFSSYLLFVVITCAEVIPQDTDAIERFCEDSSISNSEDSCMADRLSNTGSSLVQQVAPAMPQYKLLYFSLRGRAEPIRWVLAAAEQPYEDIRVDKETEWPTKKTEVPYGKVPVLYIDDVPLSQSVAICRYLGRQHGLAVEDSLDQARGDEVADAVHDLLPPAAHIVYAKLANDLEKSKNLATEFFTSTLPPVLRELNKRLEGRQWFCGEKMTWVDLFATCYLGQLKLQNPDSFNGQHRLKNLMEKVHDLPQIKKWIKERPQTPL